MFRTLYLLGCLFVLASCPDGRKSDDSSDGPPCTWEGESYVEGEHWSCEVDDGCRADCKCEGGWVYFRNDEPDLDGDGFSGCGESADCDDLDASVSPDAVEICDGVDNDCDGGIDEGVTSAYWADDDGDGFGDPAAAIQACERISGYVPAGVLDCDDGDDAIYPGAEEVCDGVDNDCDGEVDTPDCPSDRGGDDTGGGDTGP